MLAKAAVLSLPVLGKGSARLCKQALNLVGRLHSSLAAREVLSTKHSSINKYPVALFPYLKGFRVFCSS